MAEQTNPAAGVSQEAPTVEQRMSGFLERYDQEQAEAQAPPEKPAAPPPVKAEEQPESQAPKTDELTPDDLPGEAEPVEAQPGTDAFEIVHNGQQRKLSREETIRYAQQGFDYTQKTQELADKSRQFDQRLQRLQEIEQVQPVLAQELALVQALGAQLKPYEGVDWVQLATSDPFEYSKHRAQFDVLLNKWQSANGQYHQKREAVTQQTRQISAETLRQEMTKLTELIPEWKDANKYQQGATEVRTYLLAQGARQDRVDGLSDAIEVSIARKAMLYDNLLKAKNEKVKSLRTAPPVTRPGAAQGSTTASVEKAQELQGRLRKTGDVKDAAALLLNRWK